jgi:signal transduction histidine kinase/CheY-like chemotaxis protein
MIMPKKPQQTQRSLVQAQAHAMAAAPRRFGFAQAAAIATAAIICAYAGVLASQGLPLVLAIVLLVVGTGILSLQAILMLRQSEQRIHRVYTAMAAAEAARGQAEAAAREKSRMLATMSHEIRTPLNGVIGMLALLGETSMTPEQRNYANTAHASGRTLLSIIDEILDTAKSEIQPKGQRESVDLVVLVESITELLSPRAHGKGLEISARVAAELPREIKADELRLRQILFNLAGNAIKFTDRGGVAIEVSQPKPMWLRFSVRDTGIGMSSDEAARVFGEFVQANATTQTRFGGTGLGLSISKSIATSLGGDISVESKPGQGSCFTFDIPCDAAGEIQPRLMPLLNRHYVLALEKGFAREQLAKTLVELGATVSTVTNPKALAARLRAPKPFQQFICASAYFSTLRTWARKELAAAHASHAVVWVFLKAEERKDNVDLLGLPFAGYLVNPLRRSTLLNHLAAYDGQALRRAGQLLRHSKSGARRRKDIEPRQKLNILLAEDNAVNALLARTILEKLGHRVTAASDGEAARAALLGHQAFDLALLDVEMPHLSGLELARLIRNSVELQKVRNLPLLALTGNAHPADLQACLLAGMNGHLSKPFDRLDLEDKIDELMAKAPNSVGAGQRRHPSAVAKRI